MKKILLSSLVAAAAAMPAFAGVDNLNYQAVIKNASGAVADQRIEMKFELLNNAQEVVYSEEQTPTTNANGFVMCQIGENNDLTTIDWSNLTLRVSVNLGAGYEIVSNEVVSSVPSALYALKSADTEELTEAVETLVAEGEETKATLQGMSAEIARIDGLAADFENLGENLDNSFTVVNTAIAEIEGQVENLNMVSAVVRANEQAIEELNTNTEAFAVMVENRIDKVQNQVDLMDQTIDENYDDLKGSIERNANTIQPLIGQVGELTEAVETLVAEGEETKATLQGMSAEIARIDGLAGDMDNLDENLTNSFTVVNTAIAELEGQVENLNMVAAVVRVNEEAIEGLTTKVDENYDDLKGSIERNANTIQPLIGQVGELAEKVDENYDDLKGSIERNANTIQPLIGQVGELNEAVETLVAEGEETKSTLQGMSAEIARIDGLAADFENLDENLTNSFNEVNTKFEEVNGQLENLNMVSAVVRENEKAIEELNTNTEAFATMVETRIDKVQNQVDLMDQTIGENYDDLKGSIERNANTIQPLIGQVGDLNEAVVALVAEGEETKSTLQGMSAEIARIDGLAQDIENMGENLDNSFNEVNTKFEEVNGQLENLNNVAAVVRANEQAIEELNTNTEAFATMVETRIDKVQTQLDTVDEAVVGLVAADEETATALREMNAEIARIDGLAQDFENLDENLTSAFNELNTKFQDIEGQLENLNNISAVVRENEKAIEELNTNTEAFATMVEGRLDKIEKNLGDSDNNFTNLTENLDNLTTEMTTKFDEVNGQLENLNQVAAVVRANEQEIEGIKTSSEQMADMFQNLIDKLQKQVEALEAEVEALKN